MHTSKPLMPEVEISELSVNQLILGYDLLVDVLFWVKDTSGRFIYANKAFIDHVGATTLKQVVGQTDYSFSPKHLAKQYIEDDKRVVNKGEAVTDRLELNLYDGGEVSWYSTSKRPLYDKHHTIIGSYGVSHQLEKSSQDLAGLHALKAPIRFVKDHYQENITISDIASSAYLSVSALERRFKKYLLRTPTQYLTDVRLEQARRRLIETRDPISRIAEECGFRDASYFCRRFKRKFNQSPSQCRAEYDKVD